MQSIGSTGFVRKAIVGAIIAIGAVASAMATPIFEINPSVLGGPAGTYQSDFINGNASTLLTLTSPNTDMGEGFIIFNSFTLAGNPQVNTAVPAATSGFEIFAKYSYTTTITSGSFGSTATAVVDTLSFNLYGANLAGPGAHPTFTAATATGPSGTAAVATLGNAQLLGFGTLNSPGAATNNALNGTSFNATTTFQLTGLGSAFFTSPVPFYSLAFNSFTNTSQGVALSSDLQHLAINSASGGVDFNSVPEPGTLALAGLAMLGCMGVVRRRNSK